jgi:hypothetical protein
MQPLNVTVAHTVPAIVNLSGNDADGDPLTYTAQVAGYSLPYAIEQAYDLQAVPDSNYFLNARGANEKYLFSENGNNPLSGGCYVLSPTAISTPGTTTP